MTDFGLDEAKAIAMRYLARREYSQQEIRLRLTQKGLPEPLIFEVLDWLIAAGYQSDERFAESRVRHRVSQSYGPIRITHELKQQGIDTAVIRLNLEQVDCDWFNLALEALQKKFGRGIERDFKQIARRKRYLSQRGFDSEQIRYALSNNE